MAVSLKKESVRECTPVHLIDEERTVEDRAVTRWVMPNERPVVREHMPVHSAVEDSFADQLSSRIKKRNQAMQRVHSILRTKLFFRVYSLITAIVLIASIIPFCLMMVNIMNLPRWDLVGGLILTLKMLAVTAIDIGVAILWKCYLDKYYVSTDADYRRMNMAVTYVALMAHSNNDRVDIVYVGSSRTIGANLLWRAYNEQMAENDCCLSEFSPKYDKQRFVEKAEESDSSAYLSLDTGYINFELHTVETSRRGALDNAGTV